MGLINLPLSPLLAEDISEPFPHQAGWPVTLPFSDYRVEDSIPVDLEGDGSLDVVVSVGPQQDDSTEPSYLFAFEADGSIKTGFPVL